MSSQDDPCAEYPSFRPMFGGERHYLDLLHLNIPRALELAGQCLQSSPDPYPELAALMKEGWRTQLVTACSLLYGQVDKPALDLVWDAFDQNSWVVPQLTVLLSILDPEAVPKIKKRLLLGCPVKLRAQEELSPMERHVMHGTSAIPHYSDKAWSALCWRMAVEEPTLEWLLQRFGADEAWLRLLDKYGYEGADLANSWYRTLIQIRPDLKRWPVIDCGDEAANKFVARRWLTAEKKDSYQCPQATLEELFEQWPHSSRMLRPLIEEGLAKGDRVFEFTADALVSPHSKVPLSRGLKALILDHLPIGYDEEVGVIAGSQEIPEIWMFRVKNTLRLKARRPKRRLEGRISLTRDRLESTMADAICYGAKDTGEMGGGAATAVYQSCGPEVLEAAKEALALTDRQVGDVVYTPAFDHECSLYVGHLISIKTGTSQGNWCPEPERLGQGVYKALTELPKRAQTVAFSCLATGEGRAQPEEIARLMMEAARAYFRDHPDSETQVLFSLPDFEDYQAFQRVLTTN